MREDAGNWEDMGNKWYDLPDRVRKVDFRTRNS